jgi:hypothetical protein
MLWSEKNIYEGETFYQKPPFRSAFFVADSLMLLSASAIDIYIIADRSSLLSGPGTLRLLGVLLGMWLLWWKARASHRQIRLLFESGLIQDDGGKSAIKTLSLATASITHLGMFMTFLLNALLLIQIDSLLGAGPAVV